MNVFSKVLGFVFVLLSFYSIAQPNKTKEFLNIKAPAIEYASPDVNESLFEEDYNDSVETSESYQYVPYKEPNESVDQQDSVYFDDEDGELSVVEVNEQMNIDSIWVTIAQYFAIWDSRTINPYKIDGANFKDTIGFVVYDTTSGYFASMPLNNSKINSRFGMRSYRWHYGTDLGLNVGDPVKSVFDGIVRIVQYDARGYGKYVLIRHYNGFETLYGHLSGVNVAVGQSVKAGEVIGKGGSTGRSTGPHLHFEIRYEGNAINPEYVFDFYNHSLRNKDFQLTPQHFLYLKEARKIYYHKIKSGETLGSISRKYRVSISHLCKLNKISTKTILRVGRKLRIR